MPTIVYVPPLMDSVPPTFSDFLVAYAALTSTSFFGDAEYHVPDVTCALVTRPLVVDAGSTPAAVYDWFVVSVVGGLTICSMTRCGVTTLASYSWNRLGRHS